MEQRTIIYREGNGKNEAKNQWEVGFQSPKIQLGMGKTKSRMLQNYKNVWDPKKLEIPWSAYKQTKQTEQRRI